MQTEAKASCLKRLGRIEGQVRGLARMVEDDRYCIDVVTQISAVRAALRRLAALVRLQRREPSVAPLHARRDLGGPARLSPQRQQTGERLALVDLGLGRAEPREARAVACAVVGR